MKYLPLNRRFIGLSAALGSNHFVFAGIGLFLWSCDPAVLKDAISMLMPIPQINERLNNRRFTVVGNTHGLFGSGTVFHYLVEGDGISSITKQRDLP